MDAKDTLKCEKPATTRVPLVIDSPHSGSVYPADFNHACALSDLRRTEDAHIEALYAGAFDLGVPVLHALFPRCYIDANRAQNDIDEKLLDGRWPEPLPPDGRSAEGIGLIRRLVRQGNPEPVYKRTLSIAEINHRIERYYRPYHAALQSLVDEAVAAFGCCYHLNCHSMPATSNLPDIVLGDRDGTTCNAAFTQAVKAAFEKRGYRVALNHPYKGVELVRKFSNPAKNRHSLQVEINRGLYMDEYTLEKKNNFTEIQKNITFVLSEVIDFISEKMLLSAAE